MKEKIKEFLKENAEWIIFTICIIAFAIITTIVTISEEVALDSSIYEKVNYISSNRMTLFAKILTQLGSFKVISILTALSFLTIKDKKIGIKVFINILIIALINQLIKFIIRRERPDYRMVEERGFSFPSGHTMGAMGFYGFYIYLAYKCIDSKKLKMFIIAFLATIIVSIGITRIYLGVHYPTDVIAGFFVTIAIIIVNVKLLDKVIVDTTQKDIIKESAKDS